MKPALPLHPEHEHQVLDFNHDGKVSGPELAAAALLGFGALGCAFLVGALIVSLFCG